MAQLYSIDRGIAVVRPTDDVDMVVHIETRRGVPNMVARALESIGFVFQPSIDDRSGHGHRFTRVAPSAGVTAERDETVDGERTRGDRLGPRHDGERPVAVRRSDPESGCVPNGLPRPEPTPAGRRRASVHDRGSVSRVGAVSRVRRFANQDAARCVAPDGIRVGQKP